MLRGLKLRGRGERLGVEGEDGRPGDALHVVCLEGQSAHRGRREEALGVSIGPRWSEKGKLEANQHGRKSQHLLLGT